MEWNRCKEDFEEIERGEGRRSIVAVLVSFLHLDTAMSARPCYRHISRRRNFVEASSASKTWEQGNGKDLRFSNPWIGGTASFLAC
eukprot:767766-Hanusia_phi.AAC.1